MSTMTVHEAYMATVDGKETFHQSFELAVRRLIRDSCDIVAMPWGGSMAGNVFERTNFAIEKARYVKGRQGMVVVDKSLLLHFEKDWAEGVDPKANACGPKSGPELLERIDKGFLSRWAYGWKLVKKHKAH